jgi:hypothetical protein
LKIYNLATLLRRRSERALVYGADLKPSDETVKTKASNCFDHLRTQDMIFDTPFLLHCQGAFTKYIPGYLLLCIHTFARSYGVFKKLAGTRYLTIRRDTKSIHCKRYY